MKPGVAPVPGAAPAESSPGFQPADAPLYTPAFYGIMLSHLFLAVPCLSSLPVLAWWTASIGGDKVAIGQVMSAPILGALFVRLVTGPLLDTYGRRPVLAASGLVSALGFFCYDRFTSPGLALLAVRFLHGAGMGAVFPALTTYVADIAPRARRTEGIAVFGAIGLMSMMVGPSYGVDLAQAYSFTVWCRLAGASVAVGALIAAACPVRYRPRAGARMRLASDLVGVFREPRLAGVWRVTFLWGIVMGTCLTFAEPLVRERHLPRLSDFYLSYGAAAVAMRLSGGRLLDRANPVRILVPALLVQVVGLAGLMVAHSAWALRAAAAMCGIGHGYAFPILNALAVTRSPSERTGTAVIAFMIAVDLGQFLFFPCAGWIADHVGFTTLFGVVLALHVAALVDLAWTERRLAAR